MLLQGGTGQACAGSDVVTNNADSFSYENVRMFLFRTCYLLLNEYSEVSA